MASENENDLSSPEKSQRSQSEKEISDDSEDEEENENEENENNENTESYVCDVCGGDASWEDDPVLLCDGCDVGVHASCYGVKVSFKSIYLHRHGKIVCSSFVFENIVFFLFFWKIMIYKIL